MGNAVDTLLLALGDTGTGTGERIAFLNAALPEHRLDTVEVARFLCEQPFRPDYLDLTNAGFEAVPVIAAGSSLAAVIVRIGKQKSENRILVDRASALAGRDRPVFVAGDKKLGIASLKKAVAEYVAVDDGISKYHAAAFAFRSTGSALFNEAQHAVTEDGGYVTAIGGFSPGRVDPGSELLAGTFSPAIRGEVADFGAGWGYLSARLLEVSKPAALHLFEAHFGALEAARANIGTRSDGTPVNYHWTDLRREAPKQKFDTIIMNPPFHEGRRGEPSIGEAFIVAAARALKPSGRLLMVANRHLPYEATLRRCFGAMSVTAENAAYKCIEAQRPAVR